MELAIINGSPRPGKSNSKKYIQSFLKFFKNDCPVFTSKTDMPEKIWEGVKNATDILFVFPLYADGIPVSLLKFLKTASDFPSAKGKRVHVLINCGFFEAHQNDTAMEIIDTFCRQEGFVPGCKLSIGSGEAIMDSPFAFIAKHNIKKLAKNIKNGKNTIIYTSMPLTRKMFVKASTSYWLSLGRKNGITREQMESMEIEG